LKIYYESTRKQSVIDNRGVSITNKWILSHVHYTRQNTSPPQTRVKLNRVFFPRQCC